MPITVNAAWSDKTGKTTVEYDGETANVVYFPNQITPNLVKKVQANGGNIRVLCKALEKIVKSWDVMGTPQVPEPDEDDEEAVSEANPFAVVLETRDDKEVVSGVALTNIPTTSDGTYPLKADALMLLPLPFLSAVTEAVFSAAVPNSRKTGGK
jgi:hypothetical protein